MVDIYKESKDAARASITSFIKKSEEKTKSFYDYLTKYMCHNKQAFGESVDTESFLRMIVGKKEDEREFNVKIKMSAKIKSLFGKTYLRYTLYIKQDDWYEHELFTSINISEIKSIGDVSSILLCGNLYLKLYTESIDDDEYNKLYSDLKIATKGLLEETGIIESLLEDNSDYIIRLLTELIEVKEQRNKLLNEKEKADNKIKRNESKKRVCYIMVDENTNYTKIGFSVSPEQRERTLQAEKPTIKLIHIFEENHERHLHNEFSHKRVRGEWFNLTEKEVQKIIKKYK